MRRVRRAASERLRHRVRSGRRHVGPAPAKTSAEIAPPITFRSLSLAMGQHYVFPAPIDLVLLGVGNGVLGLAAFWIAARLP